MRCINEIDDDSDWIWLLGDDDLPAPECVNEFYCFLESNSLKLVPDDVRIIRFSYYRISLDGLKSSVLIQPEMELSTDSFIRKLKGLNKSSLSEYIFSAKEIRQYGFYPFPMAWFSDDLAVLQCSGFSFVFSINSSSVGVRITDKSKSGSRGLTIDKNKSLARFMFFNKLTNENQNKLKYSDMRIILRDYLASCLNEKKSISLFLIFYKSVYYKCFFELFYFSIVKSFRILMVKFANAVK
jgi:hypothetical protein